MLENNQNKELMLIEDLGMQYATEKSKNKARFGLFKCFCGNEFKTQISDIKGGHTKSCGCFSKRKTHGLRKHRLYSTWRGIIKRCSNIESDSYKYYGGRGIKVCESWLDVKNFIDDMFPSYVEGLTLDRINVNGNYEPSNCRWASNNTQNRNTRVLRTNNTSGYRGVFFSKRSQKFIAKIVVSNKQIHLGYFKTALEAAKAYDNYIIDNNLEHTKNLS